MQLRGDGLPMAVERLPDLTSDGLPLAIERSPVASGDDVNDRVHCDRLGPHKACISGRLYKSAVHVNARDGGKSWNTRTCSVVSVSLRCYTPPFKHANSSPAGYEL